MVVRLLAVIVGIALAAGLMAAQATAAVVPEFSRSQVRIGQLVTVFQPGGLSWLSEDARPIRIYLVRARQLGLVIGRPGTRKVGPPPSTLARYVGTWSRNGRLTFRIPRVQPGRYAAVAWCVPCGGTLIGSFPGSVPDDAYVRRDGSLLRILAS